MRRRPIGRDQLKRRRICGIWGRRPDLTTPARALSIGSRIWRADSSDTAPIARAARARAPRKGSRSMFWQSQGGGPGAAARAAAVRGAAATAAMAAGRARAARGPQPPDFEELLRRGQDRFRRVLLPGGFGSRRPGSRSSSLVDRRASGWRAASTACCPTRSAWCCASVPTTGRPQPGLNYHLPAPIETRAEAERDPRQPDRDRLPRPRPARGTQRARCRKRP